MATLWPFRARRTTRYTAPTPPFTPILPWQCWPSGLHPPIHADFFEAMAAHVIAHVALPGGLWFARAPRTLPDGRTLLPMPVAVYDEPGAQGEHNTAGESLWDGTFTIAVYAIGKPQVKALAKLVKDSLKDAPLVFDDGTLIYLRPTGFDQTGEDPDPGPGPDCADVFQSIVMFRYIIQRA